MVSQRFAIMCQSPDTFERASPSTHGRNSPSCTSPNCYNQAYFESFISTQITGRKHIPMAKIFPFRALRYDSSKVSVGDVVTQPYDKISPAAQDRYYKASPYNLVRIILGKPESSDNDQQNVYSRASAFLNAWRQEQILAQDH